MKILILGLPRSGTSSLYDFLRTSLPANYECKYEPYKTEYIGHFNSNCLIKSVLTNEILLKEEQTILDHTIELISNFDFVIFLKRDLNHIKVSFKRMVDLNEKFWKNKIEYDDELIDKWYFDFNKVIDGNITYEYEKIYTNDISESLIDICKKVNIVANEKQFNQYIHPKNRNNIKLKNTLI
jgi:broad-specificity NMP kinase